MLPPFLPHYTMTPKVVQALIRIERARTKVLHLPLTPTVLASLRESARLFSTHYSTMIEGNRLDADQVQHVVKARGHFPGRERDEREVLGYYAALTQVEQWAAKNSRVSEKAIQTLHALVLSAGRASKIAPSSYRDGQNVIKDSHTGRIVYMPPEAKDVAGLMKAMVDWINNNHEIPMPLIAGIAHYQFATIHPYYDGNGRTARLLTTFILHLGGYDLKGLYSLEEYYARNLGGYYEAISVGPSHNYYLGRAEADITQWVEYFLEGMATAFENVIKRMSEAEHKGEQDQSDLIRTLDPRQRRMLELFQQFEIITGPQVGELFDFTPRVSALYCKDWVEKGFLEIVDASKKGRKYRLGKHFEVLVKKVNMTGK